MPHKHVKRQSAEKVEFNLKDEQQSEFEKDRPASATTTPSSELQAYLATTGGDDLSLDSRTSNGNGSSCDSLADTEDMGLRYFSAGFISFLHVLAFMLFYPGYIPV
jgi:hypothetical protein